MEIPAPALNWTSKPQQFKIETGDAWQDRDSHSSLFQARPHRGHRLLGQPAQSESDHHDMHAIVIIYHQCIRSCFFTQCPIRHSQCHKLWLTTRLNSCNKVQLKQVGEKSRNSNPSQECLAKMGVQQGKDEVRTMDKYVGNQPHNQYHHRKYAVLVRPYGDIKFSNPYSPQGRGYQTYPGRSMILMIVAMMISAIIIMEFLQKDCK